MSIMSCPPSFNTRVDLFVTALFFKNSFVLWNRVLTIIQETIQKLLAGYTQIHFSYFGYSARIKLVVA